MLYVLFLVLAVAYNFRKFRKERKAFLASLIEAQNSSHREMILGHYFYVFIFEGFLAFIVAYLISERPTSIGILELGFVYIFLLFAGFYVFHFFIRYVEKNTQLKLYQSFKNHLIKELRVNFALIMLPILVYSLINWTFQDSVYQEWGSLWFIGLLFNIIFVSVLTISCSVILMLRLIPNREITEPEYLKIINERLIQIGQPHMRIRWIETDIKNAFVFGLKILNFSNQTMFIGRALRTTLSLEEFDAVIAHELGHVANRHIHKRVIGVLKNFLSIIFGVGFIIFVLLGISSLYWGEDVHLHSSAITIICTSLCLIWFLFNYLTLFDTIRSQEFEADAYAVMVLGAGLESFKTALEKLSTPDELPDYLKQISQKSAKKSRLHRWFSKHFSTHPDLSDRIFSLEYKIATGLPFNYYASTPKRIKNWPRLLMEWKILVPLSASFLCVLVLSGYFIKKGNEDVLYLTQASSEEIMKNNTMISKVNKKPYLVGSTLMYFVAKRRDQKLIDYFIAHGADKGKTLVYLSQLKDYVLFNKYYTQFQSELSEDEYYLILRKSAQVNFTDGYRLLVNSKQFEDLNPAYKEDLSNISYRTEKKRFPASIQNQK
jgi:Zn-dependent protease with chaperone function